MPSVGSKVSLVVIGHICVLLCFALMDIGVTQITKPPRITMKPRKAHSQRKRWPMRQQLRAYIVTPVICLVVERLLRQAVCPPRDRCMRHREQSPVLLHHAQRKALMEGCQGNMPAASSVRACSLYTEAGIRRARAISRLRSFVCAPIPEKRTRRRAPLRQYTRRALAPSLRASSRTDVYGQERPFSTSRSTSRSIQSRERRR